MKFTIRDRETGTEIEDAATLEEAEKIIEKYETEDKNDGTYTPNFYEIYNNETDEIEL